jgi:cephalosporin hydroxylase
MIGDTDPHDRDLARRMAADPRVRNATAAFFAATAEYRYSYNFSWLGRPIIQYPQDLMALQEIVWRVKPRTIVETGIAHGGSTVFFASMLELAGGDGRVVAVDVDIRAHNRAAIEAHPMHRRIDMIEGSSVDTGVAARVRALVREGPVMVVLDSDHTRDHVAQELELYAPLVTRDSYLVVMDTVVEHMPEDAFPDRRWGKGNNPLTAVREFLRRTDRFIVDKEIEETLLVTVAPSGYLRCVKD